MKYHKLTCFYLFHACFHHRLFKPYADHKYTCSADNQFVATCATNSCVFFCSGQPECAYYLRHARCGFGPSCKFHHPEPGTSSISQDHLARPETSLGLPQSDPTPFIATGIPATATATGIPASAAAVTGVPVASATAGAPGLPQQAAGVPVMPQGTPAPETLTHDADASAAGSITAAQTDAAVSTASQQQYATLPSQPQQAAAATSPQAASVAVPNMHMPAVVPSMPANAPQLPALQQSQVHALHASAHLQQAALPSIAAGMEATLPAQFVMQPEPAQQAGQAQQAQQAQQGFQQQVAVPAAGVPLQSWPLTASVATAPTAQAGTAPAAAQQASATPAVTHAQIPLQQGPMPTAPAGFSGVQQPTYVPPGQTVMVLPTASASSQYAYTSQPSQTTPQRRPAQFASGSTTAMQVPAGESLGF